MVLYRLGPRKKGVRRATTNESSREHIAQGPQREMTTAPGGVGQGGGQIETNLHRKKRWHRKKGTLGHEKNGQFPVGPNPKT